MSDTQRGTAIFAGLIVTTLLLGAVWTGHGNLSHHLLLTAAILSAFFVVMVGLAGE